MADLVFDEWFQRFAGGDARPHEWQRALADEDEPRNCLIRIPTGMGKTLGALAAWAWHRVALNDDRWPRRLVWCLPMRVLVDQTAETARAAFDRLSLLWDPEGDHHGRVGVHLLMGGTDAGGDWHLFPDEFAVLVGTQDMLLSRALNRGYASGRARWPLDFGLLSHDALWVMDEVQLMDVGLATSAQLQAYHDDDVGKGFRPRLTWWMSATLQESWFKSVDTVRSHERWIRRPFVVPSNRRESTLGSAPKGLVLESIPHDSPDQLAELVLRRHAALTDGPYGRITIVVCNTVDRACATFDAVSRLAPGQPVVLAHSRFRPADRRHWRERFLSRDACLPGGNRIIVATQVVEAGVDVSGDCMVTELAPWSSLVQRFGRCARYGGPGTCVVVDRGRGEKAVLPYDPAEVDSALRVLTDMRARGVAPGQLEAFEEGLDECGRSELYPYRPRHLLLRREFEELFDTTADLTGADLDISRFIRTGEDRDLHVFWLEVPEPSKEVARPAPPPRYRPHAAELCGIPFMLARDWLCGAESQKVRRKRLASGMRAWVWDFVYGEWVLAERSSLTPGRVVCVAAQCGGYTEDKGFDPASRAPVKPVPAPNDLQKATVAESNADETDSADDLSVAEWKTIAFHSLEVGQVAAEIAGSVALPASLRRTFGLAAIWHDAGKSHPAFQGSIKHDRRPNRQDIAKAPQSAWPRPPMTYATVEGDRRPGLRHELASALALFAVLESYEPRHPALLGPWAEALRLVGRELPVCGNGLEPTAQERAVLECTADEFDLLVYLVACHHGKVRVALQAGPKDQEYRDGGDGRGLPTRGIRDRDVLPPVALVPSNPAIHSVELTLEPAVLGLSPRTGRSWRERTLSLLDRFGPGGLAWLEALFIAADRRASMRTTTDPELLEEWRQ